MGNVLLATFFSIIKIVEDSVTNFANFDRLGFRMNLNRSQTGNGSKFFGLT
jgi:hypothetical protein